LERELQISLTNATQWTFCDVGQTVVLLFSVSRFDNS